MPLQKQEISVDLVQGSDQKQNDQINTNFNDMINVVFTGNMTAKKMNGYSVLNTLDLGLGVNEEWSHIAKRDKELIVLSSHGAYHNLTGVTQMQYKSRLGELGIVQENLDYDYFDMSDNFRLLIQKTQSFYYISAQDLNGNNIATVSIPVINTTYQAEKLIHWHDDFFFLGAGIDAGSGSGCMKIYKITPSTAGGGSVAYSDFANFFADGVFADDGVFTGSKNLNIDFMNLGSTLYAVVVDACALGVAGSYAKGFRVDSGMVKTAFNPYNGALPIIKNIQLYISSLSTITSVYCLPDSADGVGNLTTRVWTTSINTTTLVASAPVGGTIVTMDPTLRSLERCYISSAYIGSSLEFYLAHPLYKDYDGVTALSHESWVTYNSTGTFRIGIFPLTKPFSLGGYIYFAGKTDFCEKYVSLVIRNLGMTVQSVFKPGQYNFFYNVYPQARLGCRSFQDTVTYNSEVYFTAYNDTSGLIRLSLSKPQNVSSIELNKKLIVMGAMNSSYDGFDFTELGFLTSPQIEHVVDAAGGSLDADTYQLCAQYTWTDATGDEYRSPISAIVSTGAIAGSRKLTFTCYLPRLTIFGLPKLVVYIRSSTTKFTETYEGIIPPYAGITVVTVTALPDMSGSYPASTRKTTNYNPDNTGKLAYTEQELNNDPPISSKCATLHGDRLFYVSTEDDKKVFYSKMKTPGVAFEFSQFLYKQVLDKIGVQEDKIVGLKSMDGRLFVFKERSILYIAGQGPADDGTNDDFSDPQVVTTDAGCVDQRSIVLVPDGIMFKSDKGIYLLARNLQVSYIGAPIEEWNGNTIVSATLMETVNEVRFATSNGQTLVYNYYSKAWSWFTNMASKSACMYNGNYVALIGGNIFYEDSTTHKFNTAFITQTIATPWTHVRGIQGYQKLYGFYILGTYKTPHQIKISVYYDYETYVSETYTLDPLSSASYNIISRPTNTNLESGASTNGVYQIKIDLIRKTCSAVKFIIEDLPVSLNTNTGECFALSNLSLVVGVKTGASKVPAVKQY